MKKRTKRFWAWTMAFLMMTACMFGNGKAVRAYAADAVTLVAGGEETISAQIDLGWFDTYESITIQYACTVSTNTGWGIGAIQSSLDWTAELIEMPADAVDATVMQSITITEAELMSAVGVESREDMPIFQAAMWNNGYIIAILGNPADTTDPTDPAEPTQVPEPGSAQPLPSWELALGTVYEGDLELSAEGTAFTKYFSVPVSDIAVGDVYQVTMTVSGASAFKQFAIGGTYNNWKWNSGLEENGSFSSWVNDGVADETTFQFRVGVNEEGMTEQDLTSGFTLKIQVDNPMETLAEGTTVVPISLKNFMVTRETTGTAEPTAAPQPSEAPEEGSAQPIPGWELALDMVYAGDLEIPAEATSFTKYFSVTVPEVTAGDVYQVTMTVSGASAFKQLAIGGNYNNWLWDDTIQDEFPFKTWQNDGIPEDTVLQFRFAVTEEGITTHELTNSFMFKISVDNPMEPIAEGTESVTINLKNFKITRETTQEAEPTAVPTQIPAIPEDSELFAEGVAVELDKTYAGTAQKQSGSYYALANFYIKDDAAKVGDVYNVTYTVSGANYNQIGFQTDADVVTAEESYPWHNSYWSGTDAMPDGTVESFTVEVTSDGLSKYTNGQIVCKMTVGDVIADAPNADASEVTITNLKVTVTRKIVDETAEYKAVELSENVDTDFQRDETYGTLYKLIDITEYEDLNVDTIVVVFSSTGSFNGTIGTNVDGTWTSFDQTGSSGTNVWKVTGLSEMNTDGTMNLQVWWKSDGTTITLTKVILAELGADFDSELNSGSTGGTTGGGVYVPVTVQTTPTPTPTPTPVPEQGEDAAQPVKAGDKIEIDFADILEQVDSIEVTLTSNGYFNGCLGVSVDGGWDQIEPSSDGGTVTWRYSGIAGREPSGYSELQIWYANDGVSITLDKITFYDVDGNVISTEQESQEEIAIPEEDSPTGSIVIKKKTITREILGEGVAEITKQVDCNKVLDASSDDTKMYQIPMDQFAGNGTLKKITVTITYDQTNMQYWVGGAGAIGYSTDGEWQQVDFENSFIDGAKNTVDITIDVPEGVNATFDEGSILQVGWWWGSTNTITVDKVVFEFEKQNATTISIEVNDTPVLETMEPITQTILLADLVRNVNAIDKAELSMAATGSFTGTVYAAAGMSDEGSEIKLMADEMIKLGDISMDKDGYATFTFDHLAGVISGELIVDIISIEEGATVVLDSIRLYNAEGALLSAELIEEPEEQETELPEQEPQGEEEQEPTEEEMDITPDDTPLSDGQPEETADLPKTGRTDAVWFYLFGVLIAAAGAHLLKKKESLA